MNQIGLAKTFEKSLASLTKAEQSRVKQVPTDFMLNPEKPGHRLHGLNTKENRFCSISVGMDIRIIALRHKGQMVFCYVGHHDEAYKWADRRRFEIHPVTGAAQLVELEEVIRERIRYIERNVQLPPIFANEDDDFLLSLGVPQGWLQSVKQVDVDGFLQIADYLPEEAFEALSKLVEGERPKSEMILHEPSTQYQIVKDEVKAPNPFEHPDARRRFWIATDEQALRQALDYPWNRWAVFLHPTQRDAVERNYGGPARVSGGAGTGKTIVALHRAVFLARKFPSANILLTTYSRPLVDSLESGLNELAGATGDVRRRIHVEHLHKFAHDLASEADGFSFMPVRPKELDFYIDTALADHADIDISKNFVRSEFDAIVDYWGVNDLATYQRIDRPDRGAPIAPDRRTALWPIFESVRSQMRRSNRMTWSDLADAGKRILEMRRRYLFDHVVADEAQDFGPREIRFLMSLAPQGDYSHFFAGDSSQRIYRYPFPWHREGVDLRGRGSTLVVNYRMTVQVKKFSNDILDEAEIGSEDEFQSAESVSLMIGPEPITERCDTPNQESQKLADWLREIIQQDINPEEIGIFARNNKLLEERVEPALETVGISASIIGKDDFTKSGAIHVGTLHSAKGLEFRAVAMVGCEKDVIPHASALASADGYTSEARIEARERQLFFVGCTRPREILRISYCGEPTKFLCRA